MKPRNQPHNKTLRPHTRTSAAIEMAEPGKSRDAFDAAFEQVAQRRIERWVADWYDPDVRQSVNERRIRDMAPETYAEMYERAYLHVLRLLIEPDIDDLRDSMAVVSDEKFQAFAEEIIGDWVAAGKPLPTFLTDRI